MPVQRWDLCVHVHKPPHLPLLVPFAAPSGLWGALYPWRDVSQECVPHNINSKEAPQSSFQKKFLLFSLFFVNNLGFLNSREAKGIIQLLHSNEKYVAKVQST